MFPHSFGLGVCGPHDHVAGLNIEPINLNEDAHSSSRVGASRKKGHCSGALKAPFDLCMTEGWLCRRLRLTTWVESGEVGEWVWTTNIGIHMHMHGSSFTMPTLYLGI